MEAMRLAWGHWRFSVGGDAGCVVGVRDRDCGLVNAVVREEIRGKENTRAYVRGEGSERFVEVSTVGRMCTGDQGQGMSRPGRGRNAALLDRLSTDAATGLMNHTGIATSLIS